MDTPDSLTATLPKPTAARPLLGLTVLVVEDSRFACEAVRLMCLRSGARIRRADSMRSARRHLQVYRPSVIIVDLGLPDGNGAELIAELAAAQPQVQAVLAMSADDHLEPDARAAGARGFLAKPLKSVSAFQEEVLRVLPPERRPSGPRLMTDEVVLPDRIAFLDDLAHIADILESPPADSELDYVAQFMAGIARLAGDEALEDAAFELSKSRALGESTRSQTAAIVGLIQERLAMKMAI